MKQQKPEPTAEAATITTQSTYDKGAVSRLLRVGSIGFAEEAPPQFDLTVPCVKRPEGDYEHH